MCMYKELNMKTWISPRSSFSSVPFEKRIRSKKRNLSVLFLYRFSECLVSIYQFFMDIPQKNGYFEEYSSLFSAYEVELLQMQNGSG